MTAKDLLTELIRKYTNPELETFLSRVRYGIKDNLNLSPDEKLYIELQAEWYGLYTNTVEISKQKGLELKYLSNPNTINSFVTAINSMPS